jgi:ABC-type uncharacterized transport system fused permease/ATPase subunit
VQRAIIQNVHGNYFNNNVLYTLNHGREKLNGIDDRIVSDANSMQLSLSWLFGTPFAVLNHRFGFFPLIGALCVTVPYAMYLTWVLTVLFIASLIISLIVQTFSSRVTSKSMSHLQQHESELRQHYARVKNSIESITFFEGLDSELKTADCLLDGVYAARLNYALRACLTVFPTVAVYFWFSNGNFVMGAIVQLWSDFPIVPAHMRNVLGFISVMGRVGMRVVQSMGGMGTLSAFTHRISDVKERAEVQQFLNRQIASKRQVNEQLVGLAHADIIAGHGRASHTLVDDLMLTVARGESVIVMGPAACGKTSLHRLIASLWDIGRNPRATLTRPAHVGHQGLFFIPQSNYTTEGSLAEQIFYPHRIADRRMTDEELTSILTEVGLSYLIGRWGLHTPGIEWSDVLSGGEAQRLGFARMLYHQPRFACIDEATSALDLALEADCMAAAKRRNITLLSIATRMTQKRYHKKMLYLDGAGGYTLSQLEATRSSIVLPNYTPPDALSYRPYAAAFPRSLYGASSFAPMQQVTDIDMADWVDADDPDVNELLVASRGRANTRQTISQPTTQS